MEEKQKVYVLHQGYYSDNTVVGVFSTEEKLEDYKARHRDNHYRYSTEFWSEEVIIDEMCSEESAHRYNYMSHFTVVIDTANGVKVTFINPDSGDIVESDTGLQVKCCNSTSCVIYKYKYGNTNNYSGWIVVNFVYTKDQLTKIITDKIYQRLYENNYKLNDEEIL